MCKKGEAFIINGTILLQQHHKMAAGHHDEKFRPHDYMQRPCRSHWSDCIPTSKIQEVGLKKKKGQAELVETLNWYRVTIAKVLPEGLLHRDLAGEKGRRLRLMLACNYPTLNGQNMIQSEIQKT